MNPPILSVKVCLDFSIHTLDLSVLFCNYINNTEN